MLTRIRRRPALTALLVVVALAVAATIVVTAAASGARTGGSSLGLAPAFGNQAQPADAAHAAAIVAPTAAPGAPPPPWASYLPAGIVYPLLVDGECMYRGSKNDPVSGRAIKCQDPTYGAYNPFDDCYWNALNPQPASTSPLWVGLYGLGSLYNVTCETTLGLGVGPGAVSVKFSSVPPPGYNQSNAANVVLAIALLIRTKGLFAPTQATAPAGHPTKDTTTPGLVGLSVYLWATEGSVISILTKLGPISPAIRVAGINIQASVLDQKLEWDMGNGTIVKCASDGKQFDPAHVVAPACGYTYTKPGTYSVDSRSIWFITVNVPLFGNATILVVRSSLPQFITIDELQVVTQ